MTTTWGGYSGSGYGRFALGIEVSVDGNGWVSGYYLIRTVANSVNDSMTLRRNVGADVTFVMNTPNDVPQAVPGSNFGFQGVPGQNYNITGSVSGIYSGSTPSHSTWIGVPGGGGPVAPGSPSRWPDVSILGTTAVRLTSMTPVSDGGSGIYRYEGQVARDSTFTTGVLSNQPFSNVVDIYGMAAGEVYYARTRAANEVGWGDWSLAAGPWRMPYDPPAAPTGVTVTQSSDTSHTVSWTPTNPGSSTAPYQAVAIERWDNVTQAYARVATPPGGTTSWTDTTTVANRRYRYRVAAANYSEVTAEWKLSAWVDGPYRSTSPAAPTDVTASRSGSSIVVEWKVAAPQSASHTVERSQDGGATWSLRSTLTTAGSAMSWTDTTPPAGVTLRYRVRAISAAEPNQLGSPYVTTAPVVAMVAPNAPTPTGPSGPQDPTGPITLTWLHNAPDTSAQRIRQVRWRYQGDTAWTTLAAVTNATQAQTIPASTWQSSRVVEWQVRTYGAHADPSPYSATATVTTSRPPTATISTPASGTWTTPQLTAAWAFYDPDGHTQAAYVATLTDTDTGAVLETSGVVPGPATAHPFSGIVRNGGHYRIEVTVQDSTGMWSTTTTRTFTVTYPEPVPPVLTTTWDRDTGSVLVMVTNVEDGVRPMTVSNRVERSIDGGPWVVVAADLGPNGSVVDWLPSVRGENRYRAVAWSSLPSTATGPEATLTLTEPGLLYVNYGPGFSSVVRVWGNIQRSGTGGRSRAVHELAGREEPLGVAGTARSRDRSIRARLTPDVSSLAEWEAAFREAGPVACLRTPHGDRLFGSLSKLSFEDERSPALIGIGFSLTEVSHRE